MAHTLDVTFGPESQFTSSGVLGYMEANGLDDTRFFVSYADSTIGKVSIGSISGSNVTFGSGSVFNNIGTNEIASDRLTNNKIVVGYSDFGDQSRHGKAHIGNVSGTSVVFGNEYKFFAGEVKYVSIISLSDTKFVVAYRDEVNFNRGIAKIGTVSGTTITFGPEFEVLSNYGAQHIEMARIDNDKFIIAYNNQDTISTGKGNIAIGSVSGYNIIFGTTTTLLEGAKDIQIEFFDSNKFILAYNGQSSPAMVGTISGNDITFGDIVSMSPPEGWKTPAVGILDAEHFVTAFRDRTTNNRGSVRIGNISGTTITLGAKNLFNTPVNGTAMTAVWVFDISSFVVMYRDDSDSGVGKAKVGTIPISFKSTNLYVRVPEGLSSSLGTPESPNLDIVMSGGISGVPQPKPLIRIINHLTKTHDHDPQLITNFIGIPNSVNIQLWDIVDGKNTLATITSSGCYSIGETNRWAWSTEHLQFLNNNDKYHYYFRMSSDLGEENFGEFFITVPERGRWSYPN